VKIDVQLWQPAQRNGRWTVARLRDGGGFEMLNDDFELESTAKILAGMMNSELVQSYGKALRDMARKRSGLD